MQAALNLTLRGADELRWACEALSLHIRSPELFGTWVISTWNDLLQGV